MLNFVENMSMMPKGLRYKTMIAFSLMSLIPILVCSWLIITYIFPNISFFLGLSLGNMSFILFVSIFISLLGLYVTKEMIDPVIKMASEAKMIAEGDIFRKIDINRQDEVGDLSNSLNIMTQKIKDNMKELKDFGEKTKLINIEINKKVIALSSLLQIGNLISSSNELKGTIDFIVQKISDMENNAKTFMMLVEEDSDELKVVSVCNADKGLLSVLKFKQADISHNIFTVDKNTAWKPGVLNSLLSIMDTKNLIVVPVVAAGKAIGLLATGNNQEGFIFTDDEKEMLKVFTKQVLIAFENNMLARKSKELAIKDDITSLYNQNYMRSRLAEEIKRAVVYQRPCGYLLIDIDDFKKFYRENGEYKSETLLKEAGDILKRAVTEIDRVGRLCKDKFAIILPERNKRQSANIAEEIRKKIEAGLNKVTVSIGVSENPIDGSTAEELMEKAERLARDAKSLGKNRIAI